ncbi:MAG: S1/P1 nuclease [Pontixanthobacter sp.]
MGSGTIRNWRFGKVISGWGAVFALLLAGLSATPAWAWGGYGHRTSGAIALANVKPETRAAIAKLLKYEKQLGTPECPLKTLEDAAVWPDCVRRTGWRWGYTAAWHYQTEPVCEDYSVRKNCPGGNCVSAQIERNQRLLADESLPPAIRLEALAFMVHFVGDIHMPLHSGDKDDRGGNDRKAAYGIVPDMNLHSIWDGALAERGISSTDGPIVRRYSAQERADLGGGGPADWGRESWQLARDFVYPGAFDAQACDGDLPNETALSQDDIVEAVPVVQRRIRQAGLRMADMLDQAFAPGPLPQPERDQRR